MPDVTSIVLNAYDWQNSLDVLVKYLNACGVESDGEIRITPEGDFSVWLKIPNDMTPAEAVSWLFGKVTEHLDTRPFSVRFSTAMTLVTPPAPPEPQRWWASLKLTQPKTKIYTAHDRVNIYRSVSANIPPQISDVARVAMVAGTGYDVWATPLANTEWICVFNGDAADPPQPGFILWVSGNDMRATP